MLAGIYVNRIDLGIPTLFSMWIRQEYVESVAEYAVGNIVVGRNSVQLLSLKAHNGERLGRTGSSQK